MSVFAIVGAGGYVGTNLVEALVLEGRHRARAVVRAPRSVAGLARFGSAVEVAYADAEKVDALTQAFEGASCIINLTTGTPASIIKSTEVIHTAARRAKVPRLVHLSSAVVYGDVPSADIVDDSPPLERHWMPYAKAKSAAELWLRAQGKVPGLELAVLRPGIVWGVKSQHTIHIVKLLLDKSAYVVGDGGGVFNGIYIDNLVSFLRVCAESPRDASGFFNVADEGSCTWRQFFGAFAPECGYDVSRLPAVRDDRCPMSKGYALDWLLTQPLVNATYHRTKQYLPDAVKSRLKAMLAGPYNYAGISDTYNLSPQPDRELWHLQSTRHKLPYAKFTQHFGVKTPISFEEGVRRTIEWLRFAGYLRGQSER